MAIAVDVLNKQLKSYKSQVDSLLIFILILLYYMMHYKKKKKKKVIKFIFWIYANLYSNMNLFASCQFASFLSCNFPVLSQYS